MRSKITTQRYDQAESRCRLPEPCRGVSCEWRSAKRSARSRSTPSRSKRISFEAYNNRGSLYHELGHDKERLSDLNRAIELKDDIAEAIYHRGYAYLAMKDFDASIEDFDRAIELAPGMAWAYQGRGTVLMKKGLMQDAIDDFNRAIELDPKIVWAYFNRGLAQVYLGNETERRRISMSV